MHWWRRELPVCANPFSVPGLQPCPGASVPPTSELTGYVCDRLPVRWRAERRRNLRRRRIQKCPLRWTVREVYGVTFFNVVSGGEVMVPPTKTV